MVATASSSPGAGSTILVALLIIGVALAMLLNRHGMIDGLARGNEQLGERLFPRSLRGFHHRTVRPMATANIWGFSIFMGVSGLVFLGIGIYQAVH